MTFAAAAGLYSGVITNALIDGYWNVELLAFTPAVFALGALTMRAWICDAPSPPPMGVVRCGCGWEHECSPDQALAAVNYHVEFGGCSYLDESRND